MCIRDRLYLDLSINLRAVISQRLIKQKDGKRCAALEVMINSPYIADLIAKGEVDTVREAMADSSDRNMLTFDDSLLELYREGRVDKDEALSNADSPANLESRIAFG